MKSMTFYLLLYLRPLAKTVLSVVCRLFSLLSVITLIAVFLNDFLVEYLLTAAIFFAVSLGALVLQEKYTTLLLKLQPDDTEYTFHS
jgi:hypothetical protein